MKMGQRAAGMIWNGDPENGPDRKQISKHRGLRRRGFPSRSKNPGGSFVGRVSGEFYLFQYGELFSRQVGSFNMFEPFALIDMSKTRNLIGLNADWLNELI